MISNNSFNALSEMVVDGKSYRYFSLKAARENGLANISGLPFSLKILLENLLRHEDGIAIKPQDIIAFSSWLEQRRLDHEVSFYPTRVLMQDLTGVPAIVDLAAMRDAALSLGARSEMINPLVPVALVIDHSLKVDYFGSPSALEQNVRLEYQRNLERYTFLRWGQSTFSNLKVIPPGVGICHQVNLEHLGKTVWIDSNADGLAVLYPDSVVGTDSHTTMINALGILGWGVGGIEAEAVMLNQPINMLIPEVIGVKLSGGLQPGITATDMVLKITELLRREGVVGKFVEFFGSGLKGLSLEDRATIANMAPEYGATCGFFPIDEETISYLRTTGRGDDHARIVEAYAREQGLFHDDSTDHPLFTKELELDLTTVVASIAGPKRPQDRIPLDLAANRFKTSLNQEFSATSDVSQPVQGRDFKIDHGDAVICAITSCTNTSNPSLMIAAALVARNASERGLKVKPWVKTSFAPGSQVVSAYLQAAGIQQYLDQLGFNLVGYGCTTCIGNSGPLVEGVSKAIRQGDIVACAVLSGNRNFEGRINPDIRANFLASPPLVVAYALVGSLKTDLTREPIGHDQVGNDVFLRDIWPSSQEIAEIGRSVINSKIFVNSYADVLKGDDNWRQIETTTGQTYDWHSGSSYIQNPPFFDRMARKPAAIKDIHNARILALFLDSITTDHISPAGAIEEDSPAGRYLKEHKVAVSDFNSYGARRGNHQVMMRGTFANIRIKNQMTPEVEGGVTIHYPTGQQMTIYDAAMRYQQDGVPLIVFAGKEYGTGSSRDWAAKGVSLLGVRAIVAVSFERIHRSNLIGMGVLPLAFKAGDSWQSLGLTGKEQISITAIEDIAPKSEIEAKIRFEDGRVETVRLVVRIDTEKELSYFRNGGILPYVLRKLIAVK